MSRICTILPHQPGDARTLTCLERLLDQSREPDHIVVVNQDTADSPIIRQAQLLALQRGASDRLLVLPSGTGTASAAETSSAAGLTFAFRDLGADFAWVLTADLLPRPDCLEALLSQAADARTIRMSLVIHPTDTQTLGRPLAIPSDTAEIVSPSSSSPSSSSPSSHQADPSHQTASSGASAYLPASWKLLMRRADLPEGPRIPCRGNLAGALYPRDVWQLAGTPTQELFLSGEDEEYAWRTRRAGFRFVTVTGSELECRTSALRCATVAERTYFYEAGLSLPRMYLKLRNWAWLERLKRPGAPLQRLAVCGGYILFTLGSILQADDLSIRRVYNVFRALHNGFYGKLRPY